MNQHNMNRPAGCEHSPGLSSYGTVPYTWEGGNAEVQYVNPILDTKKFRSENWSVLVCKDVLPVMQEAY